MKKSFITLAMFSFVFLTYSCRDAEPKTDTVVVEKEVIREVKVEEDDKGLLEEAAGEVDKEIKKEVSEEIDKIGDNN